MIKIKDDKKVNIGLFGLKEEYLQMFQNYLEVLSEKFNCFSKIDPIKRVSSLSIKGLKQKADVSNQIKPNQVNKVSARIRLNNV